MNPFGRPKSDERSRFLAKVRPVASGCHEWQSTTDRGGYGKGRRGIRTSNLQLQGAH